MKKWISRNKLHFINIAILFALCFFYFKPIFQGKTLSQSDVIGARSIQTEINHYKEKDTTILWTNQIFGGMPTFQIWAPYPQNITTWIVRVLTVVFPAPLYNVLLLLFGSYFLFTVLKLNPWLAAAGAATFTFTSYNIILIVAGHSNQLFAIAFFAPLLAGIILTLRKRYLLGGALTALFLAMEIRANHLQMTYYILLTILLLVGIEFAKALKNKTAPAFSRSMLYLSGAVIIALMVNASILWSTYEYSTETIRGRSNLVQSTSNESKGLSKEHVYLYSQTLSECLTFLVPNAAGGGASTEKPDMGSETAKTLLQKTNDPEQATLLLQQINKIPGLSMYWGDKRPFTYGPHYWGAAICFLFISGLVLIRHPLKYWIVGSVAITILLSLGGSWPHLADLFYDHVPFYNKFRGAESILAVTVLLVILFALLTVQEILNIENKDVLFQKLKVIFYITCLLFVTLISIPELLLTFRAYDEAKGITELTKLLHSDSITANNLVGAIIKDRIHLERIDALRSLLFVVVMFVVLWAFIKRKINATYLSILVLMICVTDIWPIAKRHLGYNDFKPQHAAFQPQLREVDRIIHKDKDPYYRVVDLSQPPTFDMSTPFFHRSIWGYSEVRLKRIDEVLDRHFANNVNHPVLDMLNTKYIIFKDPKTHIMQVQLNKPACGPAWLVDSIRYVKDANEEIKAIGTFKPRTTAIVDKQYRTSIPGVLQPDSNARIRLIQYQPDLMIYKTTATTNKVAIFSEIHYQKGWKMFIDNKEQPYFRANYLLRAAVIPPGSHQLEFIFHPASYYIGEDISLAGSVLLIIALGCAVFKGMDGHRQTNKQINGK